MNNRQNPFFFEIEPIPENSSLFDEFKNQKIFFSYFRVKEKYYLFFYHQKSIDIEEIEGLIDILEELDRKERKIRSFRGFFLYALEIMSNRKGLEILKTNLEASFWRNLKKILRQNKKEVLIEFLFGRPEESAALNPILKERLENLQKSNQALDFQVNSLVNQVERLQEIILNLESQLMNLNSTLRGPSEATERIKISQPSDSTLSLRETSPSSGKSNWLENENQIDSNLQQAEEPSDEILKSFSEATRRPLSRFQPTEEYNPSNPSQIPKWKQISSNQEKGGDEQNFKTSEDNKVGDVWQSPGRISEEEKIEIIERGFQLQAEGKLSLKKYYQSTDPNSLFQSKGYSIKYETIRRTKLYQQFKPSNN